MTRLPTRFALPPARSVLLLLEAIGLGAAALAVLPACSDDGIAFAQLDVAVEVSPDRIDFGTVFGGRSATRTVRIASTGQSATQLRSAVLVEPSGPAFTSASFTERELSPGTEVSGEVRLTAADGATGLYVATLRLDVGDVEPILVPITAEVRPVPPCDDGNPCTEDVFEGGACTHDFLPDGGFCDDDNACTFDTVCAAGQCLGRPLSCVDNVECTVDTCNPSSGCEFVPADSLCDDGDSCTSDVCQPLLGCQNPPEPIGTVCHFNGCAEIGLCSAFGTCEVMPVPNDFPCEDGDPCTTGDSCQSGECTPGEILEVGPTSPVVLAEGNYGTLTGLLWNDQFTTTIVGSTVAEVLDVRRDVAGGLKVAWRGPWLDSTTGQTCTPLFMQDLVGIDFLPAPAPVPRAPPPPDDDDEGTRKLIPPEVDGGSGDGDDANEGAPMDPEQEPPPPPLPNPGCVAGVFYSRLAPSPGAVPVTIQLGASMGPVAAAITPPHPLGQDPPLLGGDTARVLVALTNEDGTEVRVGVFDSGGELERTYPLFRQPAGLNPLGRIGIARHEATALVVGHAALRGGAVSCDDFCEAEPCCTGPILDGWHIDLATGVVSPTGVSLGATSDGGCAGFPSAEGFPWITDDFKLSLDPLTGMGELSFRMHASPCGELFGQGSDARFPHYLRFDPTLFALMPSALSISPVFGLTRIEQMEHESVTARAAAIVDVQVCDADAPPDGAQPVPPPCGDETGFPCEPEPLCEERIVGWLGYGDDVALQDALLGPLDRSLTAQALPLFVEYRSRLATRVGQHVQITWREEDGVVHEVHGPALAEEFWWDAAVPLRGGDGFVAGVASRTVVEECTCDGVAEPEGDPLPCDCDGFIEYEVRRLVAQGFECGVDPLPAAVGCLVDADCGAGNVCAYHDELCLPLDCDQHPGICGADEVPCGGACVAVAEQCSDFSDPCVAPPGAEVPHCPLGSTLASVSCAWICVDAATCAPIEPMPDPTDAGSADAGGDDAGAEGDAGPAEGTDAGAEDGGLGDGGQDGGLGDGGLEDGGLGDGGLGDGGADLDGGVAD